MTPYEQGYSEVLEKLAVSPRLALKALARPYARSMDLNRLRPLLESKPRTVARAMQGTGGRRWNDRERNLEYGLEKILGWRK